MKTLVILLLLFSIPATVEAAPDFILRREIKKEVVYPCWREIEKRNGLPEGTIRERVKHDKKLKRAVEALVDLVASGNRGLSRQERKAENALGLTVCIATGGYLDKR